MERYEATVRWQRKETPFSDLKYSRLHEWRFDGGAIVPAAASPLHVNPRFTDSAAVDPEEAFVAALSSCHMLWFLYLAAKRGWVVDSYEDAATGVMEHDSRGKFSMTRVVLKPRVLFSGAAPSLDEQREVHHAAHEECFLANSVRAEVIVEL